GAFFVREPDQLLTPRLPALARWFTLGHVAIKRTPRTNVKKRPVASGILAARRRQAMAANLAVVVDPDAPGRLVIRTVPEPTADRDEALVRVHAISLNRGEV